MLTPDQESLKNALLGADTTKAQQLIPNCDLNFTVTLSSLARGLTPLHLAAQNTKCTQLIPLLIANAARLEALDEQERTPLHEAAARGNDEAVRTLVANGADVHALDKSGYTAADYATMLYPEIATFLNNSMKPTLFSLAAKQIMGAKPQQLKALSPLVQEAAQVEVKRQSEIDSIATQKAAESKERFESTRRWFASLTI
jgi:hypothetical protein